MASWQAYERCGIIHRDVSAKNILITQSGGILNDWDLAKEETDIQSSRHHERMDDMESFVLVVLYHALRYLPHNKSEGETAYIIHNVFNRWVRLRPGVYKGGEAREYLFLNNGYISRDFQLSSPPLQRWVRVAIAAVNEWVDGELVRCEPKIASHEHKRTGEQRVNASCSPLPSEIQPTAIPARTLDNHRKMIEFFTGCLEAEDWPALADDEPRDILSDV
ncbi:hypothetical protein C0992_011004 [Termitomyces sp. T32_za158]|nr:hypothetical protein C0992_011004 [Termitomyces sp. T32_za158]